MAAFDKIWRERFALVPDATQEEIDEAEQRITENNIDDTCEYVSRNRAGNDELWVNKTVESNFTEHFKKKCVEKTKCTIDPYEIDFFNKISDKCL